MSSLPARIKKDPIQNEGAKSSQDFSHYKSMGIFPNTQGQRTQQSMVRSGLISNTSIFYSCPHYTCKNEQDPIKNEGARVATR